MPFATFAAGPYLATYAPEMPNVETVARQLGEVKGVRRWQRVLEAQAVNAKAGVVDGLYRGGQCFCLMSFERWDEDVREALWPFTAEPLVFRAGQQHTDLAAPLVLTAADPAQPGGPAVITIGKAIVSPHHNSAIVFGQEQAATVSVVFRCYPYVNESGKVVWFEDKAPEADP